MVWETGWEWLFSWKQRRDVEEVRKSQSPSCWINLRHVGSKSAESVGSGHSTSRRGGVAIVPKITLDAAKRQPEGKRKPCRENQEPREDVGEEGKEGKVEIAEMK